MSQTIAAAIAAAAAGFALPLADLQDREQPGADAARTSMFVLGTILIVGALWAIDAPSWSAAINRTFMPLGAAVAGRAIGIAVQGEVRLDGWRKWIIGACLLAAIGACSIGFEAPER